jgi:hypothetical protein
MLRGRHRAGGSAMRVQGIDEAVVCQRKMRSLLIGYPPPLKPGLPASRLKAASTSRV